jgi:hypothetical protein
MTRLAVLLVLLLAGGCAWFGRDAARALADADTRAARREYPAAVAAYDEYLKRYPDDESITRARTMRSMVAELIATRAELATLRDQTTARDAEVARLRHELGLRQAEVARLRADLEALKRTDLQMERRRR